MTVTVGPALREPARLMEPTQLGRLRATRLSFIRTLLRRAIRERWRMSPTRFDLDDEGRGTAIYRVDAPAHRFHLLVFSDRLREDQQEERIVATRWDVMATLVEGDVDSERVAALRREIPFVIDGRMDPQTLMWCRANRSSRIFDHTVQALAAGRQPDLEAVCRAGYLMRTLDFRANGQNGSLPLVDLSTDHPLRFPYAAQMLGAYLVRQFSLDLVEDLARRRSPRAVALDPALARYLGVGNSSGIGLVLLIAGHPHLVSRWVQGRERALALASGAPAEPGGASVGRLLELVDRRIRYAREDLTDYGDAFTPSAAIADDLERFRALVQEFDATGTIAGAPVERPWEAAREALAGVIDPESTEVVHALIVEAHPVLVDPIAEAMIVEPAAEQSLVDVRVAELTEVVTDRFAWALGIDLSDPTERHYVWYRSVENEEPRMGTHGEVGGDDLTIDVVGEIQALAADLEEASGTEPLARFLSRHPEHRSAAERAWASRDAPFREPRMNIASARFQPVEIMRFVLGSLFGLEKLYPKSERWVRAVMMQGAPTTAEIAAGCADDWIYPPRPAR